MDARAKGHLGHYQKQSWSSLPTLGLPGGGNCGLFDLGDKRKSLKKECQREPKRRQMLTLQQERVTEER